MIKWSIFLYALLLGLSSCGDKSNRPNVLFIAIDDLRPELGCYGNQIVKTPNIDRVANGGFTFMHHYVQVPTCGASRCALLTGMRPATRQYLGNNVMAQLMATAPEKSYPETLIHQLKRNGYYTVGMGKISHSADGLVYGYEEEPSDVRELPYSWDEFLFDAGKWRTGWNAFFGYVDGENRQSRRKLVKPYERGNTTDKGYPDGLTTSLALTKLEELKERKQPFFLGVGFFKPHLPFNAPAYYWDQYTESEMPLPAFTKIPKNVSPASLHESSEFNQYALGEEKASLDTTLSDDYTRKLIHAYYACVSYIDAQVGEIMEKLDDLQLTENTIVVIWGDHGWHLGDLRVWGKHTLSEYSLKSALIFNVPGAKAKHGQVSDVVESVDIFPTLLDLCGVDLPGTVDGKSFSRLFDEVGVSEKEAAAYSYFRNGISVRTDTYRLTKYFRKEQPDIELYNYVKDPDETENIAGENPSIVQELLPLLEMGNTGLYEEK
ncbi:MAG: sulfatase [Saprospiraceae bacterium]|nr:sulfatase [Saprospiraceae bacterium]